MLRRRENVQDIIRWKSLFPSSGCRVILPRGSRYVDETHKNLILNCIKLLWQVYGYTSSAMRLPPKPKRGKEYNGIRSSRQLHLNIEETWPQLWSKSNLRSRHLSTNSKSAEFWFDRFADFTSARAENRFLTYRAYACMVAAAVVYSVHYIMRYRLRGYITCAILKSVIILFALEAYTRVNVQGH